MPTWPSSKFKNLLNRHLKLYLSNKTANINGKNVKHALTSEVMPKIMLKAVDVVLLLQMSHVAWSTCVLVIRTWCAKTTEMIEMPLGGWLLGIKNLILYGVKIPYGRNNFVVDWSIEKLIESLLRCMQQEGNIQFSITARQLITIIIIIIIHDKIRVTLSREIILVVNVTVACNKWLF